MYIVYSLAQKYYYYQYFGSKMELANIYLTSIQKKYFLFYYHHSLSLYKLINDDYTMIIYIYIYDILFIERVHKIILF